MTIERSQIPNETGDQFAYLYRHQFVQLSTIRKNGTPVPTPIWFANDEGKLYVMTIDNSWKVKRIRNNPKVLLAPCTGGGKVLGEQIEGRAYVLPPEQHENAEKKLSRKYGFIYYVFTFVQNLRKPRRTFIEIAPAV